MMCADSAIQASRQLARAAEEEKQRSRREKRRQVRPARRARYTSLLPSTLPSWLSVLVSWPMQWLSFLDEAEAGVLLSAGSAAGGCGVFAALGSLGSRSEFVNPHVAGEVCITASSHQPHSRRVEMVSQPARHQVRGSGAAAWMFTILPACGSDTLFSTLSHLAGLGCCVFLSYAAAVQSASVHSSPSETPRS